MKLLKITILLFITAFSLSAANASCRSSSVKHRFDVKNGYPHGRHSLPGEQKWIVDHVCALANGGRDIVGNMQYQQKSDSDLKDRIENTPAGRKMFCTPLNSTPTRQVFNCKKTK